MSLKHLKKECHFINDEKVWYEENGGIAVIISHAKDYKNYCEVKISWKALRGALARKDKKP